MNKGDAIPKYHWLVVQDDTGDPTHYGTSLGATDTNNSNYACTPQSLGGDPAYPANCQWPAIHSVKGGTSAEVVAQGDETTLSETIGIDTYQLAGERPQPEPQLHDLGHGGGLRRSRLHRHPDRHLPRRRLQDRRRVVQPAVAGQRADHGDW